MSQELVRPEYAAFLQEIKTRIQQAQQRAVLAVNQELVALYWHIGHEIIVRQQEQKWGTGIINQLARDLQSAFPEMKGFSARNLTYMRNFARAYPDWAILQAPLAKLPWYHHVTLLDRVKDIAKREWYMQEAIQYGWSRNILVHQIESQLYERQGAAITNFAQTLPPIQSALAQQTLKDPYIFDFLQLGPAAQERDLEHGLLHYLRNFLLARSRESPLLQAMGMQAWSPAGDPVPIARVDILPPWCYALPSRRTACPSFIAPTSISWTRPLSRSVCSGGPSRGVESCTTPPCKNGAMPGACGG